MTGYNHSILAHTEYGVQISVQGKYFYQKNTRFRHLEAFDQVIQKKFANLEFPPLPEKSKLINLNKEKERKEYLQQVLDLILQHSKKHPDLKG